MNSLLDNEPIARKSLTLIYIIDVSRSMRGKKINTVNSIMCETVAQLRNSVSADVDLRVAVLSFSNGCEWMYPEPVPIEDFQWTDLQTGGWTNLGAACRELNYKLSRSQFMNTPSLSYAPVLFLMSDGGPTDDYERAIFELGSNKWFVHSIKVAVAIGQKANLEKLQVFTGSAEQVMTANSAVQLSNLIKKVSVVSSQISSRPVDANSGNPDGWKQESVNKQIAEIVTQNTDDIDDGW